MTLVAIVFAAFAIVSAMLYRREHRRRVFAERYVDEVAAMRVRMVLSVSRGQMPIIYSPDCDCSACIAARGEKKGLPS